MGEDTGSTVPRRQLGRHLRELREKSGATVQAAARALEWSTAKLWRIETGQVAMRTHDVATMCRVYRASDDLTEALVALAGETKALLVRHLPPPPRIEVLLSETVLRRPLPDRQSMSGQLHHLAGLARDLPHLSVRVLPLAAGPSRASAGGPFAMLDFDGDEPTTVYCEGPTGALYLEKPAEVATYEGTWSGVAALALNEGQSIDLIESFAERYER